MSNLPADADSSFENNHDSRELLSRLADDDSIAAGQLFDRYLQRLLALASSRLSARLRRRFDEHDVVQSAMNSFFIGAKNRNFTVGRAGDLWRLLATITLRKLYRKSAAQTAQQRDYRREVSGNRNSDFASTEMLANIPAPDPTRREADSLLNELDARLSELPTRDREIVQARLDGKTMTSIAKELNCHERTVRRVLKRIQKEFSDSVDDSSELPQHEFQWQDISLKQHIGSGGIGKVYRTTVLATGQTVAVKALRKSLQQNRPAIRNLRHEAEILRSIVQPDIVRFVGTGQFPSGGLFLVMQWIDGRDLQQLINSHSCDDANEPTGLFEIDRIISVFRACVLAVAHLHECGILHCDIKPANFLLNDRGGVHLADFGFARFFDQRSAEGSFGGTPGYMAPEQRSQDSSELSPATDIYGLGGLLHAMLCLKPPAGKQETNRKVPRKLQEILRKSLAKEPGDRFQSVSELIAAMQDSLPPGPAETD